VTNTVTDPELLTQAIDVATHGNRSAFGRLLGHTDGSRVRTWLRGDRALPPTERRLCRVIVAHPNVARWLAAAE
jgi:DNA-binding transcriptional regulator YiaG